MKVVAIKPAFYEGSRVRVGAKLDVPDTLKGSWFAPIDSDAAKAPKPSKRETKAMSELAKPAATTFIEHIA